MATVNTTCSILLIPRWGIYGAALARVCADVCGCFLHGLWLRRLTPAPFLRGALWSSPAWIVGGSLALGAPWWTGAALWAATSLALLALARRAGLFDEVSANFFGTLGLPRWLAGPLLGFYRRRLISPPPAAGFAT
jgi:O-antigen/teichoic acid export membrane protein